MRVITITKRIKSCKSCMFRHWEQDGNASFETCNHPDAPKGYDAVIPTKYSRTHNEHKDEKQFPDFCPAVVEE